jgi:hypothetical protein
MHDTDRRLFSSELTGLGPFQDDPSQNSAVPSTPTVTQNVELGHDTE